MSDSRDKERDERHLSEAYRDIANERSPANLDARILKAARDAVAPRQARLRTWTRPLAWAATISLSLAIVLQVTEQPMVEVPAETQPAANAAPESAAAKRQDMDITQQLKKEAPAREALSEQVEDAFTPDMEMLREAEDLGRMQSNRAQLGAEPAAAALRPMADADPVFCDEAARATASSWLECIAELKDEQNHEAANIEQAAFDATFGAAEAP
ncbi:MAG: hypothetical protein WBN09_11730 [Woeseiaceae bacterium]